MLTIQDNQNEDKFFILHFYENGYVIIAHCGLGTIHKIPVDVLAVQYNLIEV